jgi:hypothetical protein
MCAKIMPQLLGLLGDASSLAVRVAASKAMSRIAQLYPESITGTGGLPSTLAVIANSLKD